MAEGVISACRGAAWPLYVGPPPPIQPQDKPDRAEADPLSFLGRLTPDEAHALFRQGRMRRWRRGAVLCLEGEASQWVAILLSGNVKASATTDDGTEVVLRIHGPGAVVGALEATDGQPRLATISALEAVEAVVVAEDAFASFLRTNTRAGFQLVRMLCEWLRDAHKERIEYGAADTAARVAYRLVELAERFGQPAERGLRISVSLTQVELASWIGSSREALSKALGSMRRRGWIETGRRTLVVRDLDALRQHAARTRRLAAPAPGRYASALSAPYPSPAKSGQCPGGG